LFQAVAAFINSLENILGVFKMRIRTIKPEFWANEKLSCVSTEAMLLAIGLLNYADDEGYFNANPALIKAAIFPLRECIKIEQMTLLESYRNIPELLLELEGRGYITFFYDAENRKYGQITNFNKHQKINKPSASKIKPLLQFKEHSGSATVGLLVGTGIREQVSGNREQGKEFKNKKDFEIFVSDFSATYPLQVKMQQASSAYRQILHDSENPEELHQAVMAGLKHYIEHKPTEQVFMHAGNWLAENRWLDRYTTQKLTSNEKNPQENEKKEIFEKILNGTSKVEKIQAEFIKRYGFDCFRSWLHIATWVETADKIQVSTENKFVFTQINNFYAEFLQHATKKHGLEFELINTKQQAA
jgi:hypothetical protein